VSVFASGEFQILRKWLSFALAEPNVVPSGIFSVDETLAAVDSAAAQSQSAGLKSVEIGITDLVSLSEQSVLNNLDVINSKFSQNGLPTYSEIASRVSKRLQSIIKKRLIKNESDLNILIAYRDSKDAQCKLADIDEIIAEYELK
jgi:hypothetical protein